MPGTIERTFIIKTQMPELMNSADVRIALECADIHTVEVKEVAVKDTCVSTN